MTARKRTSCLLRVELLESRFLLNSTGSGVLPSATPLDSPLSHTSSGLFSPTPGQSSANYPAGQDDDDKVSLSPAQSSVKSLPPPQLPYAVNLLDVRDHSPDENHDADHNHSYLNPSAIALQPISLGTGSALPTNEQPVVALPQMVVTPIAMATGQQAVVGGPQEFAAAKLLPQPTEPKECAAFDPIDPSDKLPAWLPEFPPVEIPLRANPPTINEIFLNPLAGLPIKEAVSVDLSPLNAEAETFFGHLLNLDPDWAPDVGWSEYLWLTAGIVLACGGVHYYYTLRRRQNATFEQRVLRLEEEPR